jgi:hypothetical protein
MTIDNAAVVSPISPFVPGGPPQPRISVSQVDQQLTLANGMTAGYGINDNHYDNWPVDSTGKIYGKWPLQPLRIGLLRNIPGSLPPPPGSTSFNGTYTLYFMFNPNQITSQFALNMSQAAPLYLYGAGGGNGNSSADTVAQLQSQGQSATATVPNLANSQSIGFSLFFDRSYDMLYGAGNIGNPSDDRGVLKDVAALYNLMGTFLSGAAVPVSTPCEVVFGQNGAGQLWGFTGYISNVSITYGIFRHDMIPSRCEVDLTMTTTYVASQVPGSTGGSSDSSVASTLGGLPANISGSGAGAGNIISQDLKLLNGATIIPPVTVTGPPINNTEPLSQAVNSVLGQ